MVYINRLLCIKNISVYNILSQINNSNNFLYFKIRVTKFLTRVRLVKTCSAVDFSNISKILYINLISILFSICSYEKFDLQFNSALIEGIINLF